MEIFELSDSDEENSLKYQAPNDLDVGADPSDFEFQFPSLNLKAINYVPQEKSKCKNEIISKSTSTNMEVQINSPLKRITPEKSTKSSITSKKSKSESDSDYKTQYNDLGPNINIKEINNLNLLNNANKDETGTNKAKKREKSASIKTKKVDEEKKRKQQEKQQERLRKKEEAARLKAEKQLHAKNRLVIKADYSMKMMEIIIDNVIQSLDFFTNFLKTVEDTDIKYKVQSQVIPKSITWNRTVEDYYINDQHEVCSRTKIVNEDHVLVIWDHEETINHMANDTFISELSIIKSRMPAKNLFLVIYKVETYFKFRKNAKGRAMQDDICNGLVEERKRYKSNEEKALANLPKISKKKFEEILLDSQLDLNVTSRLIENPEEMALLIHQYTRSLALLPSKIEKRQDTSKVDWFINTDSRDTVKVDKDGNGLKRLWQQQLCQFTLMSLESAEAITSIYKSPVQLIEAYANCTSAEGEILLRDVPIRRAAGPITSIRRIGPELSKKLYVMFTSKEGNIYLNE
ncbi:crossover junction endonuclease EME1-like [Phymastichus coffea]|uniref:crossover junction endonuclease EME1-like n=1 Tax=Phymastichus coffea TaxID=108790 RepID=UPI00273B8C53|nr:crossover junction endonuclease EME1-like [Phymastichus coffea]